MDKEKVKKALDHFENDEFSKAKDILKKEVQKKKNDYVKNKTGIETDLNAKDAKKDDKTDDNVDDDDDNVDDE